MPTWVRWIWITIAALGALYFVWRVAEVVLLIAFALMLACALIPVVEKLVARGIHRGPAVGLTVASLIAMLVLFSAVVAPMLVDQATQLVAAAPELGKQMHWLEGVWARWRQTSPLLPAFGDLAAMASGYFAGTFQSMLGLTGQFLVLLGAAFTVLVLTFFFLRDREALLTTTLTILPHGRRATTADVLGRIGDRVGSFVLGQMAVMATVGTLTSIGLWAVGMPYAATLGLLVGVFEMIPYFGPFLGAAPGILIAFAHSWQLGLAAMAVYFVVQQAEGLVLTPLIAGHAVGMHPVWIMISLLIGGTLLGVVGMVLAVPAAVAIQILLEELVLPKLSVEWIELPAGTSPRV